MANPNSGTTQLSMTRILYLVLGVLAFFLFIRLWVGAGSYPDIQRLEDKIAAQNAANDEQAERKRKLQNDVLGLSKDTAAVEGHARSELGMVRQGETFYQVILQSDSPSNQPPINPAPSKAHVE